MDERKRTIRDLEEKRQETQDLVNNLLEKLGETILSRLDREDGEYFAGELEEYRRILAEIADLEKNIKAIEVNTIRLSELTGEIKGKEKNSSEKNKELTELYARLGEMLLDIEEFANFAAPFKGQVGTLHGKIQSQEGRLKELDEGKHVNIFSWIGNNTQGMVVRSQLSKSQAGLYRVYAAAGEKFSDLYEQDPDMVQDISGVRGLPEQVSRIRQELGELGESLTLLRDERRKVKDILGVDKSPHARIKDLEHRIVRARERVLGLYVCFGGHIADTIKDDSAPEGALISAGNKAALVKVWKFREEIAEYDAGIEKLKASLLIDEAKDSIEKMEKMITGHRQRIAAGEKAITGLEKKIEESNRRIHELMKI